MGTGQLADILDCAIVIHAAVCLDDLDQGGVDGGRHAGGIAADVERGAVLQPCKDFGATLQQRGIAPGDRVAILSPTTRGLVTTIQACWLVGAASMVLPLPMRMGSLEEFVNGTRARIRHGEAKLLLIDAQLAAFYEEQPGDPPVAVRSSSPMTTGRP